MRLRQETWQDMGRRSLSSRSLLSLVVGTMHILDVLALVPLGRKRLAAVLAREPPVRPVLVVLVLAPRAHVLEKLGTGVAAVVALRTPTEVVVQPNRREVPASQCTAPIHACNRSQHTHITRKTFSHSLARSFNRLAQQQLFR